MSELYNLIESSQTKKLKSLEKLCEDFSPLIKKYAHFLNYEDAYNDLQLHFIESIYKIPIKNGNFSKSDAYILSYIRKSIYNEYIVLSKRESQYKDKYVIVEKYDNIAYKFVSKEKQYFSEDTLYLSDLKEFLSHREMCIFKLKFIENYSDMEIAKMFCVTRQAINKTVNIIKKKLKKYYI